MITEVEKSRDMIVRNVRVKYQKQMKQTETYRSVEIWFSSALSIHKNQVLTKWPAVSRDGAGENMPSWQCCRINHVSRDSAGRNMPIVAVLSNRSCQS